MKPVLIRGRKVKPMTYKEREEIGGDRIQFALNDQIRGELSDLKDEIRRIEMRFEELANYEREEIKDLYVISKTRYGMTRRFFKIRSAEEKVEIKLKKRDIVALKDMKKSAKQLIKVIDQLSKREQKSVKLWIKDLRGNLNRY